MERKFSLAIHDLKISGDEVTINIIKQILEIFPIPLTIHLIFDKPLAEGTALFNFISENTKSGKIEIVFHGLTHRSPGNVYRWLSFYHKYQAEYMVDSDLLREESSLMYHQLSAQSRYNPGICPPCWIAIKKNISFFESLNPEYIETLLHVSRRQKRYFSSVLSLASPDETELFFLKILARIIFFLSVLFKIKRIRVAIHECDLNKPGSMEFFKRIISSFKKKDFKAVLLKNLL